jgi:DNA repair photolyase
MGVERTRRAVDELAEDLFAPLIRARRSWGGWRLLGWDCEQGLQVSVGRRRSVVLVEFEPRDESRDCFARTGRFNACARRSFPAGGGLDAEERRAAAAVVALVRSREGRLPEVERSTSGRAMLVREIEVPRLLVPEGAGHYYINPYAGCAIGCEFCYVAERADMSRALEGLPRLPWGRWVDVKVNAPEVLRREVRRHRPGIVRLSPILTDPYQPMERHYRITRRCLEVLRGAGFGAVVLTRAALAVEDLELLRGMRASAVGFSIPTDDDRVRQSFEPGADPIALRLEALRSFHAAGLCTFAAVQPMLPMRPRRLVAQLAPLIRAVRIDRMHELERVRHLYEAAGCPEAASEGFFARTAKALRAGFAARGVRYDEMDDLTGLAGTLARGGRGARSDPAASSGPRARPGRSLSPYPRVRRRSP